MLHSDRRLRLVELPLLLDDDLRRGGAAVGAGCGGCRATVKVAAMVEAAMEAATVAVVRVAVVRVTVVRVAGLLAVGASGEEMEVGWRWCGLGGGDGRGPELGWRASGVEGSHRTHLREQTAELRDRPVDGLKHSGVPSGGEDDHPRSTRRPCTLQAGSQWVKKRDSSVQAVR